MSISKKANFNVKNTHQALVVIEKDLMIMRSSLQRYLLKELLFIIINFLGLRLQLTKIGNSGQELLSRIGKQLNGLSIVYQEDNEGKYLIKENIILNFSRFIIFMIMMYLISMQAAVKSGILMDHYIV